MREQMVKCCGPQGKENKIALKWNIKQDQVFRILNKKYLIFYLKGGVRDIKYFGTNEYQDKFDHILCQSLVLNVSPNNNNQHLYYIMKKIETPKFTLIFE